MVLGRADDASVEDQTILRGVLLRLEGTEKGLLGSKDLNGGGRELGEVHERASVGDKLGGNEFSNEHGQVRCNSSHTVLQVFSKVCSVLSDLKDLLGKGAEVVLIILEDLSSHGHFSSLLDLLSDFLATSDQAEFLKRETLNLCVHANEVNQMSVGRVVGDYLGQLGEVPRVPLL